MKIKAPAAPQPMTRAEAIERLERLLLHRERMIPYVKHPAFIAEYDRATAMFRLAIDALRETDSKLMARITAQVVAMRGGEHVNN